MDMQNFQNVILNSSKILNSKEPKNLTLNLGNNPFQCDCRLLDFLPFIGKNFTISFQINISFLIDDLNCKDPNNMKNKKIKDLDLKDVQCPWVQKNNKTDACNNVCTCWIFPVAKKVIVDCSQKNLTHIPKLVGNLNNWTTELNFSGNRIRDTNFLENKVRKNIQVLDLSNNSITSISTDTFFKSLLVMSS